LGGGVFLATGATGTTNGVTGTSSANPSGTGGQFTGGSTGTGVSASGGATGIAANSAVGVSIQAVTTSGLLFQGIGNNSTVATLDAAGTLTVAGLQVTGSKNAVVRVNDGRMVAVNALETPDSWFEDFGTARLQHGKVHVAIEDLFSQTVNTNYEYH